jgi:hypothetical protein
MVGTAETVGAHLELGHRCGDEPEFGHASAPGHEVEVVHAHGFATGYVPGRAKIEPEPEPEAESGENAVLEIGSAELETESESEE